MFAGHFAVSLALKRRYPRVPTGLLLGAGMTPDILFAVLFGAGIEHFGASPGTSYSDWQLVTPLSHGGALLATTLAVLVYSHMRGRAKQKALGLIIATSLSLAVLLHLVGDFVTDPGGLLLFGANGPRAGLSLWHRDPKVAMTFELLAVVGGLTVFFRGMPRLPLWSSFAIGFVVAGITWLSTVGQLQSDVPPETPAVAWQYFGQIAVFIAMIATLESFCNRRNGRVDIRGVTNSTP